MKGNRRANSKHSKAAPVTRGSQHKEDAGNETGRKLYGKVIYLDIKDQKQTQAVQLKLCKLGAVLETFLSKDVDYVISSSVSAPKMKCQNFSGGESISPLSPTAANTPSPFTPTAVATPSPTYVKPEGRVVPLSRGQAIAQMARARTRSPSPNTVVASAGKLGIKVIPVEVAVRWLDKEMVKLGLTTAEHSARRQGSSSGKQRSTKCKRLQEAFIKVESQCQQYRPQHKELGIWPHINLETPTASCPFDGKSVAVVRHSPCPDRDLLASGGLLVSHDTQTQSAHLRRSMEGECSSRLLGVPILTAGDLRRQQEKRKQDARRRGYCECCAVKYEDVEQHLREQSHKDFARDKSNYEELDELMSSLPSTSDFLRNSLLRHCTQQVAAKPLAVARCLDSVERGGNPSSDLVLTLDATSPRKQTAGKTSTTPGPQDGAGFRTPTRPSLPSLWSPTRSPLSPLRSPRHTFQLSGDPNDKDAEGKECKVTVKDGSTTGSAPLQAVVVRRPGARGVYGSPRSDKWRHRPSPHTPQKATCSGGGERTLVFANTPMASLRPLAQEGPGMDAECRLRGLGEGAAVCKVRELENGSQDIDQEVERLALPHPSPLTPAVPAAEPVADCDGRETSGAAPASSSAGRQGQHRSDTTSSRGRKRKRAPSADKSVPSCRVSLERRVSVKPPKEMSKEDCTGGVQSITVSGQSALSDSGPRRKSGNKEQQHSLAQSSKVSPARQSAEEDSVSGCGRRLRSPVKRLQQQSDVVGKDPHAVSQELHEEGQPGGLSHSAKTTDQTVPLRSPAGNDGKHFPTDNVPVNNTSSGHSSCANPLHTCQAISCAVLGCQHIAANPLSQSPAACARDPGSPSKSQSRTHTPNHPLTPKRISPRLTHKLRSQTPLRSPERTPQKRRVGELKDEEDEEICSSPIYLRETLHTSTPLIVPVRKLRSSADTAIPISQLFEERSPVKTSKCALPPDSLPTVTSATQNASDKEEGKCVDHQSRRCKKNMRGCGSHQDSRRDTPSLGKVAEPRVTEEGRGHQFSTPLKGEPGEGATGGLRMKLIKLRRPPSTKKVRLSRSWQLLSDHSMSRLLHSETEASSFDGFHGNEALPSDLSYEYASEVEVTDNEEREWLIDEARCSDSEGGSGGEQEEDSIREFIPTFSSPNKFSDSSWDDACEWYLSHSMQQQLQSQQLRPRSPRKEMGAGGRTHSPRKETDIRGRKRRSQPSGSKQQGVGTTESQPRKKRRVTRVDVSCRQLNEQGSPKRRRGRSRMTREVEEAMQVDEEVLFNYASPHKQGQRLPVSPLAVWNGRSCKGLGFAPQGSPTRHPRAALLHQPLPAFKLH